MEKNITVRLTAGKNNEISAYVKTEIKKNVLIIKHKHIKLEVTEEARNYHIILRLQRLKANGRNLVQAGKIGQCEGCEPTGALIS